MTPSASLRCGALALILVTPLASAAVPGWYVGASVGVSDNTDFDSDALRDELIALGATNVVADVDNRDTGYKLFAGYKLSNNLSVEAGYVDLGGIKGNATYQTIAGSPLRLKTDTDGYFYSVLFTLPIRPTLGIYARVGGYTTETRFRASFSGAGYDDDSDDSDLLGGFGVLWKPTADFGVRAEWERYFDQDSGGTDIDLYSVGVVYDF